eukprot:TRINITY_DN2214_c0_g1_i1.p1 TRINITY_DN2214_c0_g1~~TRINITY_DN2214_c0_g1_i1.p1  ORF type:complete len:178 (-),score=43.81 TRINITY_DN2214_c0_g1_i1:103-636(-)
MGIEISKHEGHFSVSWTLYGPSFPQQSFRIESSFFDSLFTQEQRRELRLHNAFYDGRPLSPREKHIFIAGYEAGWSAMYEEVDDELNRMGGVDVVALNRRGDLVEEIAGKQRSVWDKILRHSKRAKKPMIAMAREKVLESARRGSLVDVLITSNEFRKLSEDVHSERKKKKKKKNER